MPETQYVTVEVESLEVRCLLAAGDLDPSFGVAGRVTILVGSGESGSVTSFGTIQSDGKVVIAGVAYDSGNHDFSVVRFNADGTLDTSFGADGKVITDFGSSDDFVESLALQPDGKIVVAGKTTNGNLALARYNIDGSLDTSFDGDGMLTTPFGSSTSKNALALQSDGKIVVTGGANSFAVARFNSDGSFDLSFDGDGKATTSIGPSAVTSDSVLQSDGKIIIVGAVTEPGGDRVLALARFNPDGSLDNTFDSDGKLTTDLGGSNAEAKSVVVLPDGRVLVGGYKSSGGNGNLALVRYQFDGTLDTSFDGDGILTTNFGIRNDHPISIVLQADGKVVTATTPQFQGSFAVLRFNTDGVLDLTFGPNGMVTTDFDLSRSASATNVDLQSDGKIVVFGQSDHRFAVARYLSGDQNPAPVDQPPSINSPNAAAVAENSTAVLNVSATDAEGRLPLYGIIGGADLAKFTINAFTGALSFVAPPDFEHPTDSDEDNRYQIQVAVSDGANLAQQAIEVTVTDTNEAPLATSAAFVSVLESSTAALIVSATDPENDSLTYLLSGGDDQALFDIDSASGVLSFKAAPDFENPADANQDNLYSVQVRVSDGTNAITQTVTVSVTNVDETPTITSSNSFNIAENSAAVLSVLATDPEGHSLFYGIVGGADQARFSLNFLTGALSFVSPPDFERPSDADGDNEYEAQIAVSDGTHLVTQNISVTVTDVDETATIPLPANGGTFKAVFLDGRLHLRNGARRELITPVTLASGADVQFNGSNAADRLTLDRSWSRFTGRLTFIGNGGNDRLDARPVSVNVTFNGGEGNDTFLGGQRVVTIAAGEAGLDSLSGGDGNDRLSGDDGEDSLSGGTGTDSINGGEGDDSLSGGDDRDTLLGDAGNDSVTGDSGADSINGGDDDDLLVGGTGNDSIDGSRGEDVIDGGDDNDNLKGSDGDDAIRGGNGNDTLSGGNGNDLLTGSAGNDSLLGDAGTDTLLGDDGNDKLNGGLGTDTINGFTTGLSKDTISDTTKIIDTSFTFDFDDLLTNLV